MLAKVTSRLFRFIEKKTPYIIRLFTNKEENIISHYSSLEGEFVYYYQPLINTLSDMVVGVESLIRFEKTSGEVLYPIEFISEIENTKYFSSLTKSLIIKASYDFYKILDSDENFKITFNVSPSMLLEQDLIDFFSKNFNRCSWIVLEITERDRIECVESVKVVIKGLREIGISIYLDDIGTGYGDALYLKELDIDGVKIDKSFVQDILGDDTKVIDAYIKLYNNLGLSVIAEGVEGVNQSRELNSRGVYIQQGFYFSRAIPITEFNDFIIFRVNRVNRVNIGLSLVNEVV